MSLDNIRDQLPMYASHDLYQLDRVQKYKEVLGAHLNEKLKHYSEWFTNYSRFKILASLIKEILPNDQKLKILDIGCGAFASKILIKPLEKHEYVGVDYTPEFNELFPKLQEQGWLKDTELVVGDALKTEFQNESFDLIVMHDIFYEKWFSFEEMLNHYHNILRPGGYLVFDVMDIRLKWIWSLMGRGDIYRRYDLKQIENWLTEKGYDIESLVSGHINKKGINRFIRSCFWRLFGQSNDYVFMVKKRDE